MTCSLQFFHVCVFQIETLIGIIICQQNQSLLELQLNTLQGFFYLVNYYEVMSACQLALNYFVTIDCLFYKLMSKHYALHLCSS
jgi:hypothetical protein